MLKPHTQIPMFGCGCVDCEMLRAETHKAECRRESQVIAQRVGHAIRKLREGEGKTLSSVADRLKITKSYLSAVECGIKSPPKRTLVNRIRAAIKTAK